MKAAYMFVASSLRYSEALRRSVGLFLLPIAPCCSIPLVSSGKSRLMAEKWSAFGYVDERGRPKYLIGKVLIGIPKILDKCSLSYTPLLTKNFLLS